MRKKYETWISDLGLNSSEALGKCQEYCDTMGEIFPELIQKRGFYHDVIWGRRMHFWMETPEGDIIDPTVVQFPTKGSGEYEALEGDALPIGRCMNCGELVFVGSPDSNICSQTCNTEFATSLNL